MIRVGHHKALLGESPVWHPIEECLYHVDITGCEVIRTDIESAEQTTWGCPEVAACVFAASPGAVVALSNGLHLLEPDTGGFSLYYPVDFLPLTHRFNDGTIGREGECIIGTMRRREAGRAPDGELWLLRRGQPPVRLLAGFWTINGLAVSADGKRLFVSDSAPEVQRIWIFDYDSKEASLKNELLFFELNAHPGRPDGAAIDRDGGYWIAATQGFALLRFDARGRLTDEIELTTCRPTKPAFAGPQLDRLFVTSVSQTEDADDPLAGFLCEISCDHIGLEMPLLNL